MKTNLILCNFIVLLIYSCNLSEKNIYSIPKHSYYINSNTIFDDFVIDPEYLKKMGRNEKDTMIILTSNKMIFILGQYGVQPNDSIIIPYSGEFQINFEVNDNQKYNLQLDTIIKIGNQKFVRRKNVNFQWWNEKKDRIVKNGKGSVIVSGP